MEESKEELEKKAAAEEKKERASEIKLGLLILAGIVLVFICSQFIIHFSFDELKNRAEFGDSNGAINTFFSALAFGGIIFTILLQRKELKLQRQELRDTREELKRSAQAQEDSNSFLNEQLRLNVLPVLEFEADLQEYKGSPNDLFVRIINKTNNAFDFMVSIISLENDKKTKYGTDYQVFQKNEFIECNLEVEDDFEIHIRVIYMNVMGDYYEQTVLLHSVKSINPIFFVPTTYLPTKSEKIKRDQILAELFADKLVKELKLDKKYNIELLDAPRSLGSRIKVSNIINT